MAKYECGDLVTFYFVIGTDDHKTIKAWTDSKKLVEYYLEFHNNPKFILREVTARIEDIRDITEDNYHNEITIANIYTKDGNEKKMIVIPTTDIELTYISEETNSFFSSKIDYGALNEVLPYLKPRYYRALKTIFLESVIRFTVHNQMNEHVHNIDLDQLKMLIKTFPNDFN